MPQMKVLFTSGFPDEAVAPDGGWGPGVSFLPKPFTLEMLAWKVREALAAPQQAED